MADTTGRIVACMMGVLLAAASLSRADDLKHVRTEVSYLHTVFEHAVSRSSTLSTIVERIDRSNVIAYVTCEHFISVTIEGRTMWVAAVHDVRYVRVQVDCLLPRHRLVAILGHELQHVAEVAAAPDVVDVRSFGRLFGSIGFSICHFVEQFETPAAIEAGERVRREVFSNVRRLPARAVAETRSGDSH